MISNMHFAKYWMKEISFCSDLWDVFRVSQFCVPLGLWLLYNFHCVRYSATFLLLCPTVSFRLSSHSQDRLLASFVASCSLRYSYSTVHYETFVLHLFWGSDNYYMTSSSPFFLLNLRPYFPFLLLYSVLWLASLCLSYFSP